MFCHFKQRTVPGAFYSLPGNWNFFSLRKFCKDLSKWKSKGVMSGECGEWIRTSQPSCKFLPGHQSNMWSCIILMPFLLTNSRCFFLSSAFSCLIGSSICWNCLIFWKELIIDNSLPVLPYAKQHLLWMKTSLLCGWWLVISLAPWSLLFHIIIQYSIHFSSPVLKWKHFHYVSVENYMWKYSQEGFFQLT